MIAFVSAFFGVSGRGTGPALAQRRSSGLNGVRSKRNSVVPARMTTDIKTDVPDVLKSILARKEEEVAKLKAEVEAAGPDHPIAKRLAGENEVSGVFYSALKRPNNTLTVIAEIKRKSPSKGHIAYIKDPALLSRTYWEAGASCISVLTDYEGFGGTLDDLREVVSEQNSYKDEYPPPCPVLRKDFTIDEIQIAEAAVAGASAVLLIVSALGEKRTKELLDACNRIGVLCCLLSDGCIQATCTL
uniref:indole-3-glycerol-phosphate synthase n=1 Tax=Rhodosorus marinus TaxID=101924 RepID=A0A7S2ZEQ4_9RHOD